MCLLSSPDENGDANKKGGRGMGGGGGGGGGVENQLKVHKLGSYNRWRD